MLVSNLGQEVVRGAVDKARRGELPGDLLGGEEAEPPEFPARCDLLFIFALSAESGGLVDLLDDMHTFSGPGGRMYRGFLQGRSTVIVESGVGRASAEQATREAITAWQPAWVISTGFAGGLHDELKRGHLLVASEVATADGASLELGLQLDAEWLAAARGVHAGRLLTVDQLVRTSAEKHRLGEEHRAAACDMESFAVAQQCAAHKTRCLCVRIISDAVDQQLPLEVEKLLAQQGWASRLGVAAAAIVRRPSSALDMWQLKEDALKASDRLAKFLASFVAQLPLEDSPAEGDLPASDA